MGGRTIEPSPIRHIVARPTPHSNTKAYGLHTKAYGYLQNCRAGQDACNQLLQADTLSVDVSNSSICDTVNDRAAIVGEYNNYDLCNACMRRARAKVTIAAELTGDRERAIVMQKPHFTCGFCLARVLVCAGRNK